MNLFVEASASATQGKQTPSWPRRGRRGGERSPRLAWKERTARFQVWLWRIYNAPPPNTTSMRGSRHLLNSVGRDEYEVQILKPYKLKEARVLPRTASLELAPGGWPSTIGPRPQAGNAPSQSTRGPACGGTCHRWRLGRPQRTWSTGSRGSTMTSEPWRSKMFRWKTHCKRWPMPSWIMHVSGARVWVFSCIGVRPSFKCGCKKGVPENNELHSKLWSLSLYYPALLTVVA